MDIEGTMAFCNMAMQEAGGLSVCSLGVTRVHVSLMFTCSCDVHVWREAVPRT